MSEKVTVSIPHRLGKDEALRRIKAGFSGAREKGAGFLQFSEESWEGDQVRFNASMLGQTAAGTIDVREDQVMIDVTLPWLLAKMAEKAKVLIEQRGKQLLLDKK